MYNAEPIDLSSLDLYIVARNFGDAVYELLPAALRTSGLLTLDGLGTVIDREDWAPATVEGMRRMARSVTELAAVEALEAAQYLSQSYEESAGDEAECLDEVVDAAARAGVAWSVIAVAVAGPGTAADCEADVHRMLGWE